MSTSPNKRDEPTPPDNSTVVLLLGDIADTTWRMFMPVIGGIGLGYWADNSLSTGPWLTVAGMTTGIVATIFLIKQQFKKVKNDH